MNKERDILIFLESFGENAEEINRSLALEGKRISTGLGGRLAARDGKLLDPHRVALRSPGSPMQVDWSKVRFGIPAKGSRIHVIGSVPGQLLTEDP